MPDTNTQTAQAQRPRLRGALHVWAAVAALIAGPVLCVVAAERGGQRALVGSVVYAVTLFGLFAISATFHRVTWRPRAYMTMKRLDHSMIYVFIAGCYTAFCQILLE
ncbi:MAG: hemolysin III family protein, partial [Phycisphaerales bacterium]